MDSVEFSAPGKLVLFGEYAVLFGAPAVVAAVDRRALANFRPSAGNSWEVSAPGLAPSSAQFEIGPGAEVRWLDEQLGRGTFGLVERLLVGIGKLGFIDLEVLPTASMTLDTRAFFENDGAEMSKLGLGSSAALTVALASALEFWADKEPPAEKRRRLQVLVDLHRGVQGGAGSGIDVAASFLGGVIRYQLAGDGSVADTTPLELPEGLRMVFAWTGRAASTGDFLGRLRAHREEDPSAVNPVLDELGCVSASGVSALAAGNTGAFLDQVDVFWSTLDQLGTAIGMPILSNEHQILRRLAEDCGVRYKPSGAGGGDLGVGFTTDPSAAAKLTDRAVAEGFRALDLRVDMTGLAGPGL